MKRRILFILALALCVFLMFSACGRRGGGDDTGGGAGSDAPSDTDAEADTPSETDKDKEPEKDTGKAAFAADYFEPGQPIKLVGVPDGVKLSWKIYDFVTGSETERTTESPSLMLGEKYKECRVTVEGDGVGPLTVYCSELPIIKIECETGFFDVQRDYCEAELEIAAPKSFGKQYSGGAKLRVRGNSTAALWKKPFKVKLDKKADLLGIDGEGESKHWVLLANARDPALLRNKALMDFSEAIGTEAHISSEYVTLIYNGEYCGVYQLTEHVRIGKTSVDIFDWEEYAEDMAKALSEKYCADKGLPATEKDRVSDEVEDMMMEDFSWMGTGKFRYDGKTYSCGDLGLDAPPKQTGGFLAEMDFYHQDQSNCAGLMTAYAQPLYFSTPDPVGGRALQSFMKTELYSYARNYLQSFEYAVHSDDFFFRNSDDHYVVSNWWDRWGERAYDRVDYRDDLADGKHYSDLFDMDSLVQNFIFCEVAMNWDSMKNSFFVYKDIDGKAKIGPQWDFDWAWGNETWKMAFGTDTWAPEAWHCTFPGFMVEQYYQEVQWNCLLIRDPYFLTKVYEAWHEMRDKQINDLVGKGGAIDQLEEKLRGPAAANDALWADLDAFGITFDQSMDKLREFVTTRMRWLDEQFSSMDSFVNSLGVWRASAMVPVPSVKVTGSGAEVSVSGLSSSVKYVKFQINGKTVVEAPVSGGKATATVGADALTSGLNCVVANACDSSHNYIINDAASMPGNYLCPASNFATFER